MRKIVLLCFMFVLIQSNVFAKTVKVEAITPFDSNNPPHAFKVRLIDDITNTTNNKVFYAGTLLNGYIYQTIPPKRLKQDASFIYIPTSYEDVSGVHALKNTVCKYTTKIDIKNTIADAAYAFGTVPIMVATAGYFAAEGVVESKNNNKSTSDTIKNSAENVYNNSPLSLIKKGDFLKIESGETFLLNFTFIKEQTPNYNYKPVN